MNVAELTRERIQQHYDGKGIACKFVRVDDHKGIKFYTTPGRRDRNREVQALGAIWGFCPKVYENVDLPNIGYWGYEVELVKVAWYDFNMPIAWRGQRAEWKEGSFFDNEIGQKAVKSLAKKMFDKVGVLITDLHEENYGFTDDGRLVIIDVGV